MTVLTEQQAQERLNRSDESLSFVLREKKHSSPNRGKHGLQGNIAGNERVSLFAQELIGTAAHFDKRKNVAREFNVSETSVSNYKHGKISTEQVEDGKILEKQSTDLKKGIRKRLDDITDLAAERLLTTLGLITDEKLETVQKVTDLTVIAKNLGSVIDKANPKESGNGQQVQVNLFVPGQMKEADFESIPVVYNPVEER